MRTCSAVLFGVLALVCMRPALAEVYVGIESRTQAAKLELESATDAGVSFTAEAEKAIDEAIGTNSVNAIRVGYIAEIGSDLFLDASVAIGSVRSSSVMRLQGPVPGFLAAGEETIEGDALLDSTFYIDFGANVRGIAGSMSYTGGLRIEMSSFEEDTYTAPGATATTEFKQRNIVIEGTVGVGEEVRGFVGLGLNMYKGEETETFNGVEGDAWEFKYDLPLVIFVGMESRGEMTNAFARVSLIGEKFLSTYVGAAVKF